jgi:signal peptidase I
MNTDDGARQEPAAESAAAAPSAAAPAAPAPAAAEPAPATTPARAGPAAAERAVATPAPAKPRPRPKPAKKKSFMRELPGIVISALVISVLIKTFLVQAFFIPSGSMENTLAVDDRVLVNKLADKADEIRRGDVVVFRDPGGWLSDQPPAESGPSSWLRDGLVFVGLAPAVGEEDLIKRVIGIAGDKVACCEDGQVTVNGVQLTEDYLYPGDEPSLEEFSVTVPKNQLWVMGDHRSVSEDSRAHRQQPGNGFVPIEDVVGRAFTIVWPVNRAQMLSRPPTFDQPALNGSGSSAAPPR